MKTYGLDPAEIQVWLWSEDSKEPITLTIGKTAPSGYVYSYSSSEKMVIALDEKIKKMLRSYLSENS
jgi:hypothetical protein